MKLSAATKGKVARPYRVLLYGPEGVGKSTFGADAPSPIFLGAEDGTAFLDVTRFPSPAGGLELSDFYDALRELIEEKHNFRTLVVDTLDWLEPVVWRFLCQREKASSIEEVGGGYGKGYTAAVDEWRRIVAAIERMQSVNGMNVVLLAHSHIKTFKNPTGDDYDRYSLKLNEKAGGLLKEWADDVLFARHEELAHKDDKTKRVRGVSTGARLIHTARRAAWDAKTRHSLPEELPLSWADFDAAARSGHQAEPEKMREEIVRKAKDLGGDLEKKALEVLEKAGLDVQSLTVLDNRLAAKLAEKEQ